MSIGVDHNPSDGPGVAAFQDKELPLPQGRLEDLPQETPVKDDKGATLAPLKHPVAKDEADNVFDMRDPNNPKYIGKYENGTIVRRIPNRFGSLD